MSLGKWTELAPAWSRRSRSSSGTTGRSRELKFRRGAVLDQHLGDAGGRRDVVPRGARARPDARGRAHALQAYLSTRPRPADGGRRGARADLRADRGAAPPRRGPAHPARAREVPPRKRVALLLRIGQLESKLGNAEQAWDAYAKAFAESPRLAPRARGAREPRDDPGHVAAAGRALREGAPARRQGRSSPPALERELLLVVAVAYDEKLGQSDKAVEYFRRAQQIQPEDASALVALERLYTRTERWSDLLDTLTKKATLVSDAGEREQIRTRIATVWEEMLGNVDRPSSPGTSCSPTTPATCRRCARSIASTRRKGDWRELADNLQQQLALTRTRARRSRCWAAWACCASSAWARWAAPSRPTADPAARARARRDARGARAHPPTPSARARARGRPAARARLQDPRRLAAPHRRLRDPGAPRRRSRGEDRAPPPHRRRATRSASTIPARAYEALGRALKEDPLNADVQATIERLARALGKLADLVARYEQLVGRSPTASSRTRSITRSRSSARSSSPTTSRRRPPTPRRWTSSPRDLEAANALEQLYLRGSDYPNLVALLLRKAEIVDGPPRRRRSTTRRRRSTKRSWRISRSPSTSFQQVLSRRRHRPRRARPARAALHPPRRAGATSRTSTRKKAELGDRRRPRRSRCCSCSVRSTTASCNDPERAIETYTSIIDLDPDDFDAAQALDRLYLQTRALVRPAGRARAADRAGAVAGRGRLAPASASASCGASTSRT